jgi:hypothetical protein
MSPYTTGAQAPQDRASVVARDVLHMVAQSIMSTHPDRVPLHTAVSAVLRDEFSDIKQQAANEIRLNDE